MRLSLTVVDPVGGGRADAVLDAEPESPVADLIPEFVDLVGGRPVTGGMPQPAGPPGYGPPGGPPAPVGLPPVFIGGVAVDPAQPLAQSPIREGVVVSLYDPSGCPPGEYSGFVELRVAGGPAAGGVFRLGIGRVDIGSGSGVPLRVADPTLPDRALTLRVASDGTCKVTAHNGVSIKIDGTPPPEGVERVEWPLGGQVAVGDTLLELAPYYPPDAALHESEDGIGLDYNRPPRLVPPTHPTHFRLPKTPEEPERRPMPWAMALMPLVGATAMAFLLERWVFLILAGLGPIAAYINWRVQTKRSRERHAAKIAEYEATSARVRQDAQNALIAERFTRRHAAPDPGVVLNSATGPRTRLWERRRTDDDYLRLRVGTSELDSEVVLTDPDEDEHKREVTWKVADAPTTVPLKTHGVIGFAGPGDMVRAMGRWAVGQIAALHSPNDVQIYVLTDSTGRESWEWVRWLPHCRPKYEQNANALIGSDAETVGARIAELTSILESRAEAVKKARGGQAVFSEPDVVIVFDGSRRMRTLPGVIRLLKEGPAASMVSICLDDEERFLPGECQAVAVAVTAEEASADPWQQFKPRIPASGFPGGTPLDKPPAGHPAAPGQPQVPGQFGRPGQPFQPGMPGQPGVPGQPGHPGAPGQFGPPGTPPGGAPAVGHAAAPPWQQQAQAAAGGTATSYRLRVEQKGMDRIHGVLPDLVSPTWCTLVSRALAPLRDISDEAEGAGLPASSRLLDVLQLEPPTPDAIAARWQYDGQSTTAVIGESYDGVFAIDLRRDGPHGLIAGTTGSGKSELLQTIVAALAVANTPENMTFVLVDYKGGSAFKDCVQLPHTVGMVTDLDNHLVERALRSLGAELTRREHILAGVGAKDIEDYQDLLRREPGRHAVMPRLLIVIDEFASMARELPDFVKGLVNIAQRGRSLGIHLLLATQRPSGVVSPEIRANTNLRIALRVTDAGESTDVINSPDASLIAKSTPGRAYVRLGAASLVPFQSGRVGGRRPGASGPTVMRPWSKHLDWHALGRDELKRPPSAKKEAEDDNTDLRVLVEAVIVANERLGFAPQHSPWLPSLPETLLLDDIPRPGAQGALPAAPFGLEDIPEQQARKPLAVDFKSFGHLLVAGAPRTGRSQLLRTIAGSLARTHSTEDVHIYGFDCGNGALNILTRLPHCGAVVGRNQVDRAKRLLARLVGETSRRQELLAQDALADINEQRATAAPEDRLPHIVVLVDRWDGWTASLGTVDTGALTDQLFLVMREGASVGIHVIVTGDPKIMTGRIGGLSEDKYAFRLPDRTDYTQAGLRSKDLPDEIPPGRIFRSQSAAEIQIGVLSEDLSGQGQAAALAAIGDAVKERDAQVPRARRPFRVDVLPKRLTFDDAWELRDPETSKSKLWSLIGVGGDELTAFGPDMGVGIRSFVIAGPAQSGRSTVLCHMARCFLRNGVRMVLCTPRESPLAALENEPGVLQLITGNKLTDAEVAEALKTASVDDPIVFMMDDAEELRRRREADEELKAAVVRGAQRGISVIVAGDEAEVCSGFSGWQAELKKAKRGLLLSPATHRSGELIGAKLPRSAAVERPQPGSGVLHLGDGTPLSVRIPVP